MAPETYIYVLSDPATGEIRYVGKANDPGARLTSHLRYVGKCHRTAWLQSLLARGLRPSLKVLQSVPKTDWQRAEQYWIEFFRSAGCPLTNATDGGDGALGCKQTPEQVAKRIAPHIGAKRSEQARATMSAVKKGKTPKFVPSFKGGHHSAEERARRSRRQQQPVVDQYGRIYSSQEEAERVLGLARGKVSAVLSGARNHAGGYKFQRVEMNL